MGMYFLPCCDLFCSFDNTFVKTKPVCAGVCLVCDLVAETERVGWLLTNEKGSRY